MMCTPAPDRRPTMRPARAGFSLIELSVVLAIVSIVAVMGLELTAHFMNRTAYKVTVSRLETIDRAMVAYRKAHNKLPCPAYEGLTPRDACYGKERNGSGGGGSCANTNGSCLANNFSGLSFGDVPARDLGLPLSMMQDGYGQRIYYVVNTNQTYTAAFSPGANFINTPDALAVRSGKLDDNCTAPGALCQNRGNASYFLFSVGADKRMGRSTAGTVTRACQYTSDAADVALTDGLIDTANCRLGSAITLVKNGSTAITVPANVFYDSRFNTGTTDNHFDDLVKWRSKGNL